MTSKPSVPKNCLYCEKAFIGYAFSKFCSDTCRHAHHARNRTEVQHQRRKKQRERYAEKAYQNNRAGVLRRNFGITVEQYDELLKQQDHRCAVCKKHEDEFSIKLAVDHDHQTGEIRGLLCNFCNHRVIGRHRQGGLLTAAAAYLERDHYTGWLVPPKKKKRKRRVLRSRKS